MVPKRVSGAKKSLKYYSLLFCCKFGGKPAKSGKIRVRKTTSFRQECPFKIYITLSADGQALEVQQVQEEHSHPLHKTIYDHLPRQRRICPDTQNEVKAAFKLKANKKLLQQHLQQTTGKVITLKDLSNIRQHAKKEYNHNDLEHILDYLKHQENSRSEIIIDDDQNFEGLFYQDEYMSEMFEKFPELILVDATYKLLELRMPLYLLLIVDGNGLSEIVAIFILPEETQPVIKAAVKMFIKFNLQTLPKNLEPLTEI